MKIIHLSKIIMVTVVAAMGLFSSCSSTHSTVFHRQKYTDFKKGGEWAIANKNESTKTNESTTSEANSTSTEQKAVTPITQDEPVYTNYLLKDGEHKETAKITHKISAAKLAFHSKKILAEVKKKTTELKQSNRTTSSKNISSPKKRNKILASEVALVILSIFLPPIAVLLKEDDLTINFWVDLLLTAIFWLPGIIFALLVVYDKI